MIPPNLAPSLYAKNLETLSLKVTKFRITLKAQMSTMESYKMLRREVSEQGSFKKGICSFHFVWSLQAHMTQAWL